MARPSEGVRSLTLGQIAELVDGRLEGPADRRIDGADALSLAGPGQITFCTGAARREQLRACRAGAVLLPHALEAEGLDPEVAVVRVRDPYLAIARVLAELYPQRPERCGVHASAVLEQGVRLGEGASVGAHAFVGRDTVIGAGSWIGPGCVIGRDCRIGEDCLLHARVTLYDRTRLGDRVIVHAGAVIGADGFGYARDGLLQVKVAQLGHVLVEDDVEIGANACIDRGTFGPTRIGRGTKIDNLVQIGHNCRLGAHCAVSGLAGLSGSTVLEDGVILGGNVGTAGHQVIGAGSLVAAKSGVHGDVAAGSVIGGYPHLEIGVWRRVVGALPKLPELLRRVRRLERRLASESEERR